MAMPPHLSKKRLGYKIHTNCELGMMLRGEKPLAVFSDVEGAFPAVVVRYLRMFDRHVQAGCFVKREHRSTIEISGKKRVLLTVLYALPAETARIDEMLRLRQNMSPWTVECERREGMLLGYTEKQNDIWIALYRSRHECDDSRN
jgi:hypothetical protein